MSEMTDPDSEQIIKKRRIDTEAFDEENPFTKGNLVDEVELKFDTGQSLFVSKSFLSYASPVFERMFLSEFKEKCAQCIELKEKDHDAFLEMLLWLHPRLQKKPSSFKAKEIYQLAYEYNIPTVLNNSRSILLEQIRSLSASSFNYNTYFKGEEKLEHEGEFKIRKYVTNLLNPAFEMLGFAETYMDRVLSARSVERISTLPIEVVSKHECFNDLSDAVKINILMARLARCDSDKAIDTKLKL